MSSLISGVLTSGLGASSSADNKNSPQKIGEAATQFESLLIGQLLKSMHDDEDGEGWLGTGDDRAASSTLGLADQYLAQAMSKRGGIGIAKSVAAGLSKAAANSSSPATQPQPQANSPNTPRTDH